MVPALLEIISYIPGSCVAMFGGSKLVLTLIVSFKDGSFAIDLACAR